MAKKFFWKVILRPNALTKSVDNDYIAEISTVGNTLRNDDIAAHIVKERSELRRETIKSVLDERDSIVLDAILNGTSVQDGNLHIAPQITGTWIGAAPVFNPDEHKIGVVVTATADLRKSLEEVGVEIIGKKTGGGAVIGLVTDVLTGKTDGTVSVGGDIIITGDKIKIAPDDDPNIGVFFVSDMYGATPLDYPVTENKPKKIVCRVPTSLGTGEYTLRIVTRYANSKTLLNDPRTIEYELPLKIQ
jgi:hypothetical protein